MLPILEDGSRAARARLAKLAKRGAAIGSVEPEVRRILAAVARSGDRAVLSYCERLDGVRMGSRDLFVSDALLEAAEATLPARLRRALRLAHRRLVRFHERQRERGFELREDGIRTGLRIEPLHSVGVYVPGGTAAYPSSVLMNVVPARVAGVAEIIVATPPSPVGLPAAILAAARMAGATRVLRVGGAQAVAALAYGTQTIPRVDKIVGPGNRWVATAKRLVFGDVDIDMIAGPSEVLIVGDGSADPGYVAADMLAQAEHDPLAAAICLTTSVTVARAVAGELERQLAQLPRRHVARRALARHGAIIRVASLRRAAELADEIAPEHLELFVRRPRRMLAMIHNAGAVFLGELSSEALGDYVAGPNHVLPTGGTARFASPLGVYDFVKRVSIIEVSRRGLERLAPAVERLARSEGLEGHALAVERRLGKRRS